MGKRTARFQVDSRLAKLLSQEYSSTERALKELVDNAWDGDAGEVQIELPAPMTDAPIVVRDNGSGMTQVELERHYLFIAADRRAGRGERTAGRQRLVKGRKGIGKFAGLMAASEMAMTTRARGTSCRFTVRLDELAAVDDIERLPINIISEPCDPEEHGTEIVLTGLHANLAFPDPKKLRQVLLQEYGRAPGFDIVVDGKPLGVDDVDGTYRSESMRVEGVGEVKLQFAIAETRSVTRQPGLVLRVDGKVVGKPSFFGLDQHEDFPQKLLSKLHGEIDASGLKDHVTAGWDSVIENSELLAAVQDAVVPIVREAFKERYGRDMQLAQARLKREVNERLSALPAFRREFAERAIQKVLDKFFGEPPARVEPFIYVLLEAIERSDYGAVLTHLAEASRRDVASLAEALNEFGLAEMAHLVERAGARKVFLDQLEALADEPSTLEAQMHTSIERNLWLLGAELSMFSSNKTLRKQAETLGGQYVGDKGNLRPDLLLNEDVRGACLLIEFKRPNHRLKRQDYTQAIDYRHELRKLVNKSIQVLVIGGVRDADFPTENLEPAVEVTTYHDLVATARRQIEWQLSFER